MLLYIIFSGWLVSPAHAAEAKLRTDRASLREQCTWYFQDKGVSAREALPLMKIAIDEVGPIGRWRDMNEALGLMALAV